ncbi:macrolide export ATP-binding/permease protein MacB [bacterium BMS3Abin01]|nr:macrolide export ATP-binding/permease protein MacB [bacterium BMS3Abin01]
MRTIRNVFRRKLRAFLTISGITIGIFALVVMGAMAEKITLLVDGGTEFYKDKVTVTEGESHGLGGDPMSVEKIRSLENMDEVAVASADISITLEEEMSATFGMPDLITGTDMRGQDLETFPISFADGRDLTTGDLGKVIIGSDLVKKLDGRVGNTITVRGREFEVVGVLNKTFSMPDKTVYMNLSDAQDIFYETLPEFIRPNLDKTNLATGGTIYPTPGTDPDQLADKITAMDNNLEAVGPQKFQDNIAATTGIFTMIVYGVALISLVVGGLSVINTMTMSVYERTREIGIRKALGASDGMIIRQFLGESGFIGLMGGLLGLGFGAITISLLNKWGEASGNQIFLLTNRLVIGSVVFAVFLGVASGLYPAWHAARMNPVQALRHE